LAKRLTQPVRQITVTHPLQDNCNNNKSVEITTFFLKLKKVKNGYNPKEKLIIHIQHLLYYWQRSHNLQLKMQGQRSSEMEQQYEETAKWIM
jgi:hypothetical protein